VFTYIDIIPTTTYVYIGAAGGDQSVVTQFVRSYKVRIRAAFVIMKATACWLHGRTGGLASSSSLCDSVCMFVCLYAMVCICIHIYIYIHIYIHVKKHKHFSFSLSLSQAISLFVNCIYTQWHNLVVAPIYAGP
jgi:hypothetical protein